MKKAFILLLLLTFMLNTVACAGKSELANSAKERMEKLYGENEEITGEYDEALSAICTNGIYVGTEDNSVLSYKGIPYAKQPIGELRWKPPVPADDDTRVYEAFYYGKSPIQTEAESEVGSYYKQGEDCLTLNVWTNSSNPSKDKTVMVFFHGGSYGWGATSDPLYDGHNLVEKFDDIVLVTVEYRTGLMGFVDFSSVEGGEAYKESGNLGLLDQIEALRWVQKNIEAFGGDPDNVTIFGESAGGGSVSLLPLIDGTEGLFQRIIAQSGSVALTYSKEECRNLTEMLLKETGCKTMEELVALPESVIVEVNEKLNESNNFPERDGIVLPEDLYAAYESGATAGYDMLIGTNADEVRYWIMEMGYYSDLIDGKTIYTLGLPVMYENNMAKVSADDMQYVDAFMEMQTDKKVWNLTEFYNEILFRIPALTQAEAHVENGGNAYVYQWTYPDEDETVGACHAIELSYIFNNLQESIYTGDNINEELADIAQNMWVNFARTGDPGTSEIEWPPYSAESKSTMILGEEIEAADDYKADQRRLIEPLLKYGFNGCYSQLSFSVPQVYKMLGVVVGALACVFTVVILLVKKTKRKI